MQLKSTKAECTSSQESEESGSEHQFQKTLKEGVPIDPLPPKPTCASGQRRGFGAANCGFSVAAPGTAQLGKTTGSPSLFLPSLQPRRTCYEYRTAAVEDHS
eukprot:TRINITY_DN5593_c0_g3_i1.p1 TRINITY_DN5593_c0_g3~~TRINITY_DN5593_c0_g3_i1.p1  ORF type:complete len:102 (+),score=6.88 TRINITY_DN5593_c0_g3_i1:78-383(+)